MIDIVDKERNQGLLTVGAYLDRDHVTGHILHNQLYTLPRRPTPLAFEDRADPGGLGDHTAAWLESVHSRPITRDEWIRDDEVYAFRYVLAGLGPIVEGHVRTKELGPPDKVLSVRVTL